MNSLIALSTLWNEFSDNVKYIQKTLYITITE